MKDQDKNAESQEEKVFSAGRASTFILFIVGLILTGLLHLGLKKDEDRYLDEHFVDECHVLYANVKEAIGLDLLYLLEIESFFNSSDRIGSEEFEIFTDPHVFGDYREQFLENADGHNLGVSWHPLVPLGQRTQWLKDVKGNLAPDFVWEEPSKELASFGYLPRHFANPRSRYDGKFGENLYQLEDQAQKLHRSVAEGAVTLIQREGYTAIGFLCKPIYLKGSAPITAFQRSKNWIGFLATEINFQEIFDTFLTSSLQRGIEVKMVLGDHMIQRKSGVTPFNSDHNKDIPIGVDQLKLEFQRLGSYQSIHGSKSTWLVTLTCLGFLCLLVYIFDQRGDMLRSINLKVQEKTESLKGANRELVLARDQAEAAAQAKADFLANMSHEIRTPLTGVFGMLDLLKKTPVDETQMGYIDMARSSSKLLLTVINDILDFSKIESGKMTLENVEFNLRREVENIFLPFSNKANQLDIELVLDFLEEVPGTIIGDPVRISQILTNLIGNAVKFTEGGEIVLRISCPKDDRLRFEVRDTGIGIKKEHLNKIFESFSQANTATTRRFGGTGLGLTITKNLVSLMDGKIDVTSEMGKGSTFSVEIPLKAGASSPLPFDKKDFAGTHAIVVDDNATNLLVLTRMLLNWGITSDQSLSGEEALEMLARGKYDIAILDYHMPNMNGIQLAQKIRENPETKMLKLVMASSGGSIRVEERQKWLDSFLVKPIRQDDLLNALGVNLLDRPFLDGSGEEPLAKVSLSGRVLLVDDLQVNLILGEQMLKNMGLKVEKATSGKDAVEMAAKSNYKMILMDCQMPEMDGFEATRQIRSNEKNSSKKRTPVIALTAFAMKGDMGECLAAGMDDYISKPYTEEDLNEKLSKWFSGTPDVGTSDVNPIDANPTDVTPSEKSSTSPIESSVHLEESEGFEIDQASIQMKAQLLEDSWSNLVETFEVESEEVLNAMRKAYEEGDVESFGETAHSFKGIAGNMGGIGLSQLAGEFENSAREGSLPKEPDAIETLGSELKKLNAYLAKASC